MRRLSWCGLAMLSGCGYVGEPLPPALHIPMAVTDLQARQRGTKLLVRFTMPVMTTENLPIPSPGEIDLRIGPATEGAFDLNAWTASAVRIPASGPEAEADVAAHAGKEIFAAVRTAGPKGRWSDWSNVVAIRVVPPVPVPDGLKAEATPEGVRLQWNAAPGASYRVFRQALKEESMTLLAAAAASPFVDANAAYEKPYRYQVQAFVAAGAGEAESDPSAVVEIVPLDTFPPPVPAGLTALAGVNAIELAWDPVADPGLRGYSVYRSSGGDFERIAELAEAPAYSDKTAQPGKTYRYAVTAIDQKGNESAKSAIVDQTLP